LGLAWFSRIFNDNFAPIKVSVFLLIFNPFHGEKLTPLFSATWFPVNSLTYLFFFPVFILISDWQRAQCLFVRRILAQAFSSFEDAAILRLY